MIFTAVHFFDPIQTDSCFSAFSAELYPLNNLNKCFSADRSGGRREKQEAPYLNTILQEQQEKTMNTRNDRLRWLYLALGTASLLLCGIHHIDGLTGGTAEDTPLGLRITVISDNVGYTED